MDESRNQIGTEANCCAKDGAAAAPVDGFPTAHGAMREGGSLGWK